MKKDHLGDRQKPTLDHILGLLSNTELGTYISGHLLIESVLVQLIELKMNDDDKFDPFDLSFPNKAGIAKRRGLIDESMEAFLLEMNCIRNRLVNRLGEPISFDLMFGLAKSAYKGGVDFSDYTIHTNRELSYEWYGVQGIIQEIFQNAAQDLSFIMEQHGGVFQFG